ncbi:tRNA pseudouridine(55) synthase TruB [Alterisphingorhabdus coralli]|uniref:tRNA pseudouridine synthase B n=1 Tax=Alterisphingorhabdus coralli TaxID=3071408 RepID=A0AA97I1V5_9SPHN|nr:tRNA pseudouridine(55) synthase TruB [Parasphingorhabdus sp. SCSIO 66989]WOE76487.1 tRNA pseudouridine(55) synthase TruB [Parasphingorhabdus sp. SCSIO 66989]
MAEASPHGWIILDKPLELGSTQAVGAVKRNFREAGIKVSGKGGGVTKVGHGGTLDPLATGVLPIALGEATKLSGRMLDAAKMYDFTICFGTETDTLDAEGAVVAESDVRPTLADVEAVLQRFTGPIEQVPPTYSALKVDGQRAYDRARAGEQVQMKARAVTIHALTPLPFRGGELAGEVGSKHPPGVSKSSWEDDLPNSTGQLGGGVPQALHPIDSPHPNPSPEGEGLNEITLTAHVSKGTYIRSLARDIARAVNTVGHVTMLRRTKAGPFTLEHAISLDKLNEIGKGAPLEDIILPFEAGLDGIPALSLTPDQARRVQQGQVVTGIASDDGEYWVHGGDLVPLALVSLEASELRVIRGFNINA